MNEAQARLIRRHEIDGYLLYWDGEWQAWLVYAPSQRERPIHSAQTFVQVTRLVLAYVA